MDEKNEAAEKTELPTAKRIKTSKAAGQRPNFAAISVLTGLLGGVIGVAVSYCLVSARVKSGFVDMLTVTQRQDWSHIMLSDWCIDKAAWVFCLMLPFFLSLLITTLIGAYASLGFSLSAHAFRVTFNHCNPLRGLQRLMSRDTGVNFLFSVLKCLSVLFSVFFMIKTQYQTILSFEHSTIETAFHQVMVWGFINTLMLIGSCIFWVGIEIPYQKWSFLKKIKMSKKEMQEEIKQEALRTEIKSKIKQIQYQSLKGNSKEAIKSASLLITDGYCYAVLLRYAENKDVAPVVVTKGAGLSAKKIKKTGHQYGIIEIINPPLARQLFTQAEKGRAIPPALYAAVAKLWAYLEKP